MCTTECPILSTKTNHLLFTAPNYITLRDIRARILTAHLTTHHTIQISTLPNAQTVSFSTARQFYKRPSWHSSVFMNFTGIHFQGWNISFHHNGLKFINILTELYMMHGSSKKVYCYPKTFPELQSHMSANVWRTHRVPTKRSILQITGIGSSMFHSLQRNAKRRHRITDILYVRDFCVSKISTNERLRVLYSVHKS